MPHFLLHNSFSAGQVLLSRMIIYAIQRQFPEVQLTLECRRTYIDLWQDLGLPIQSYQEQPYSGLTAPAHCPPEAHFINLGFGVFTDLWALYGLTYAHQVHAYNRQISQYQLQNHYLLPLPAYSPMLTIPSVVGQPVTVQPNSVFVENGPVPVEQNYFYLNEQLGQLAAAFPHLTFYCAAKPLIAAVNVVDCSSWSLLELSWLSDRCIALLTRGGDIDAVTYTETNRLKPRCIVGWDLPIQLWSDSEGHTTYVSNIQEIQTFLASLKVCKNRDNNQILGQVKTLDSPSFARKPSGLFINTSAANCSIYESGKMAYQALLLSNRFDLDYLELSEDSLSQIGKYDFYVFNYHPVTMGWLDTRSVKNLPGLKATLVLETLPNDPFILCPKDDFDVYCAIDPTMSIEDIRVYAFPRPLEVPDQIASYTQTEIPIIGSFGFATPGKGFELVVDAVNREFNRAVVRINIPSSTYADDRTWLFYKKNYANYLADLCRTVAKPGIEVIVTNEFLTKQELINWCAGNTLNCFLYSRSQPGLAATTDQAISSGRPLAISGNPTFRHIHTYITPYPIRSLKQSILYSQLELEKIRQDWQPKNFALRFEQVLADFKLLHKEGSHQKILPNSNILNNHQKSTVLIVSHAAKQCGIYQYGINIFNALKKSKRYNFSYAECSKEEDLYRAIQSTQPQIIIYNYYPFTMPWLNKQITRKYSILQLGIMHEVTQEEADRATSEMFDYHLCPDPTLVERNPIVFKTSRLIPNYSNQFDMPDIITIGSFGFGFEDKGFERLIQTVQEQLDEARIVLHIPSNDRFNLSFDSIVRHCQNLLFKPNIKIAINHDFLTQHQLLDFLAANTLNAFLYDTHKHRGISSCIEHALAVQRPIAITKCGMFRHILSANPSICIEDVSLSQIIENGIAPLVPFYNDWSETAFIHSYELILDIVLERSPKYSVTFQSTKSMFSPNDQPVHWHSLCKFLKSRQEVHDCTQYLLRNGLVTHRLECKNWDIANIVWDLSDGNLLDMGSSDSFLLKNASIKGIKGEKYGIDLQEPDVPVDGVKYIIGDLMDTQLSTGFFQNITCLSVIEHDVNFERFAKEASRLLVEGGKLYVTFDYANPKVVSELKIFDRPWNILDAREVQDLIDQCAKYNLHVLHDVDWSFNEAVINANYHSPDPMVSYTFGLITFEKTQSPQASGLTHLDLRETTFLLIPDWSVAEETLGMALKGVMVKLLQHPDRDKMTVVIYRGSLSEDQASLMLSGVIMEILMEVESEVDVDAGPTLSFVGDSDLKESQWQCLLAEVQARIALDCDDTATISRLHADTLPLFEWT